MPTTSAASRLYAEQLVKQGLGLPLWLPEPDPYREVQIGDVGFIRDGGFVPLFNIMYPASDDVNEKGVPENFVPIHQETKQWLRYTLRGPVCSMAAADYGVTGELSATAPSVFD